MREVPIEVSARHIHLSKKDMEALFGKGYLLEKGKSLKQPGDFLAKEKVEIESFSGRKIPKVGIIGPLREKTQVELSQTDFIFLKLEYALRDSGKIKGTPGIYLKGPKRKIKLREGVINTRRHIHMDIKKAEKLGLKNGDLVSVKTKGRASVTFHNVRVRVKKDSSFFLHLDTDEGNAACIPKSGKGIILL